MGYLLTVSAITVSKTDAVERLIKPYAFIFHPFVKKFPWLVAGKNKGGEGVQKGIWMSCFVGVLSSSVKHQTAQATGNGAGERGTCEAFVLFAN